MRKVMSSVSLSIHFCPTQKKLQFILILLILYSRLRFSLCHRQLIFTTTMYVPVSKKYIPQVGAKIIIISVTLANGNRSWIHGNWSPTHHISKSRMFWLRIIARLKQNTNGVEDSSQNTYPSPGQTETHSITVKTVWLLNCSYKMYT